MKSVTWENLYEKFIKDNSVARVVETNGDIVFVYSYSNQIHRGYYSHDVNLLVYFAYTDFENGNITDEELIKKEKELRNIVDADTLNDCAEFEAKYLVVVKDSSSNASVYYVYDDITKGINTTFEKFEKIYKYVTDVVKSNDFNFNYGLIKDGKITEPFHPELND